MSRLAAEAWAAEPLRRRLEPLLPGLVVEIVAELASTNSALLERVREAGAEGGARDHDASDDDARGDAAAVRPAQVRRSIESAAFGRGPTAAPLPCLLVAERQTDGRGRLGRRWHAAAGASLTFSLGVAVRRADLSGLSLAVGVALAEALVAAAPAGGAERRPGLKWPNDLCLVDAAGGWRKLGGILIETRTLGDRRWVVIGVGLNVGPLPAASTTVDGTALASVRELHPAAAAPDVLARVAPPLLEALRQFERAGFAGFVDRYAALDLLAGRPVRSFGTAAIDGVARGVAADGALRVETAGGAIRSLVGGEVSVRPVGAAVVAPC